MGNISEYMRIYEKYIKYISEKYFKYIKYKDKMSDVTLKGVSQIYSKYISGSAEKERVAWFDIG